MSTTWDCPLHGRQWCTCKRPKPWRDKAGKVRAWASDSRTNRPDPTRYPQHEISQTADLDIDSKLRGRMDVCPFIRNGQAAIDSGADAVTIWKHVALGLSLDRDRLIELAARALENSQQPLIFKLPIPRRPGGR